MLVKKSTKLKLKRAYKRSREALERIGQDLDRGSKFINKKSTGIASGIYGGLQPMRRESQFIGYLEPPPQVTRMAPFELVELGGKKYYKDEFGYLIPIEVQKRKYTRRKKTSKSSPKRRQRR